MGKKGGRNKLKRVAAPRSWDIPRKGRRFVYKPSPGTHPTESSYPLGVIVRDLAAMAERNKEIKYLAKTSRVLVDGRSRKSPNFPIGLFNVVSFPSEGVSFRIVPTPKGLRLAKVDENEAKKKLCSVNTKTKVHGGRIQYGLHDGRCILEDKISLSPGDALLLELPSQKIIGQVRLAKNSMGLVLTGDRAGQLGKILDVKKGTISRERMVKISLPSGEAEIPSRLVFPVGQEQPMITVGVSP
jgi:small subunit ribosomal protein S4e